MARIPVLQTPARWRKGRQARAVGLPDRRAAPIDMTATVGGSRQPAPVGLVADIAAKRFG